MGLSVLVTGGAGYLGCVLVRHLLAEGHRVTVLDRLIHPHGQSALFQFCHHKNFRFMHGDCRDESCLRPLVSENDAIIPLAGIVGAPACEQDRDEAESVNFMAIAILERLRSPRQMLVYPCTNSGYGYRPDHSYCTEDSPLEPISWYGVTKVRAEKLLLENGNAVSLRKATLFGASQRMRLDLLVNDFAFRAFRDGFVLLYEPHFRRSILHVEDAARAYCHCIQHYDEMKGRAFNVGDPKANYSKLQIAENIRRHFPKFVIHCAEVGKDPDQRNCLTSYERIRSAGFVTQHSLDEGIEQLKMAFQMIHWNTWGNAVG